MDQPARRGLVLGGGGITGIAWETGLLLGLRDAGADLTRADLVVGTSAGSAVGAQVTSELDLGELYDRQQRAVSTADPPAPRVGTTLAVGFLRAMLVARGDIEAFGRTLGAWSERRAAAGRTVDVAERYAAIRRRLPDLAWPPHGRLRITAVDVRTGRRRVFDGSTDVSLLDAVAASCAVPGVYPPITVDGSTYIDGGVHSTANADLARECGRVVVLAPIPHGLGPMRTPSAELEGVPSMVLAPDQAARKAIGRNVLDPSARAAAARAGRAQAASVAARVGDLWR